MSQFPPQVCYNVFRKLDKNFSQRARLRVASFIFSQHFLALMKKACSKQGAIQLAAKPEAPAGDIDFLDLRREIRNRVGRDAIKMVNATIDAVNNGQYAALKYLFEAVGLFPADSPDQGRQPDGLTPALLRGLGLPEIPDAEHGITKDSRQD
jgi:hypothetical protein